MYTVCCTFREYLLSVCFNVYEALSNSQLEPFTCFRGLLGYMRTYTFLNIHSAGKLKHLAHILSQEIGACSYTNKKKAFQVSKKHLNYRQIVPSAISASKTSGH
jgi:hypothetical protein